MADLIGRECGRLVFWKPGHQNVSRELTYPILYGDTVRIGSADTDDIRIKDNTDLKTDVVLVIAPDTGFVQVSNPHSGETLLNDQLLTKSKYLIPGDVLDIKGKTFIYHSDVLTDEDVAMLRIRNTSSVREIPKSRSSSTLYRMHAKAGRCENDHQGPEMPIMVRKGFTFQEDYVTNITPSRNNYHGGSLKHNMYDVFKTANSGIEKRKSKMLRRHSINLTLKAVASPFSSGRSSVGNIRSSILGSDLISWDTPSPIQTPTSRTSLRNSAILRSAIQSHQKNIYDNRQSDVQEPSTSLPHLSKTKSSVRSRSTLGSPKISAAGNFRQDIQLSADVKEDVVPSTSASAKQWFSPRLYDSKSVIKNTSDQPCQKEMRFRRRSLSSPYRIPKSDRRSLATLSSNERTHPVRIPLKRSSLVDKSKLRKSTQFNVNPNVPEENVLFNQMPSNTKKSQHSAERAKSNSLKEQSYSKDVTYHKTRLETSIKSRSSLNRKCSVFVKSTRASIAQDRTNVNRSMNEQIQNLDSSPKRIAHTSSGNVRKSTKLTQSDDVENESYFKESILCREHLESSFDGKVLDSQNSLEESKQELENENARTFDKISYSMKKSSALKASLGRIESKSLKFDSSVDELDEEGCVDREEYHSFIGNRKSAFQSLLDESDAHEDSVRTLHQSKSTSKIRCSLPKASLRKSARSFVDQSSVNFHNDKNQIDSFENQSEDLQYSVDTSNTEDRHRSNDKQPKRKLYNDDTTKFKTSEFNDPIEKNMSRKSKSTANNSQFATSFEARKIDFQNSLDQSKRKCESESAAILAQTKCLSLKKCSLCNTSLTKSNKSLTAYDYANVTKEGTLQSNSSLNKTGERSLSINKKIDSLNTSRSKKFTRLTRSDKKENEGYLREVLPIEKEVVFLQNTGDTFGKVNQKYLKEYDGSIESPVVQESVDIHENCSDEYLSDKSEAKYATSNSIADDDGDDSKIKEEKNITRNTDEKSPTYSNISIDNSDLKESNGSQVQKLSSKRKSSNSKSHITAEDSVLNSHTHLDTMRGETSTSLRKSTVDEANLSKVTTIAENDNDESGLSEQHEGKGLRPTMLTSTAQKGRRKTDIFRLPMLTPIRCNNKERFSEPKVTHHTPTSVRRSTRLQSNSIRKSTEVDNSDVKRLSMDLFSVNCDKNKLTASPNASMEHVCGNHNSLSGSPTFSWSSSSSTTKSSALGSLECCKDLTSPYEDVTMEEDVQSAEDHLDTNLEVSGVEKIHSSPKSDSTNLSILKHTFEKMCSSEITPGPYGVKSIFTKKSPLNDLTNVEGVRDVSRHISPMNNLTEVKGAKDTFNSSPINDLKCVKDVKLSFNANVSFDDLSDVEGTQDSLKQNSLKKDFRKVEGVKYISLSNHSDIAGIYGETPNELNEAQGIKHSFERQNTPSTNLRDVGVSNIFKKQNISKNDVPNRGTTRTLKQNTPRNDLSDVAGVNHIFDANTPRNDLRDVEGVKQTFKRQNTPRDDLQDVERIRSIFRRQNTPKNDLSDVRGVKRMLNQNTPHNSLSDVVGVKRIFDVNTPQNDLRDVKGVKQIFKWQNVPRDDLQDVEGVRNIFRRQNTPKNDLRDVRGVKRLLNQNTPRNSLSDVVGVKRIFDANTPRNDLSDVEGVKQMFKRQNTPRDDLQDVEGVKNIFRRQNTPKNDLTDVRGVKRLLNQNTTPRNDLRDVEGVKQMFKRHNTPQDDLRDVAGVSNMFKRQNTPKNDLTNVEGIKKIMEISTPENDLANIPPIKTLYSMQAVLATPNLNEANLFKTPKAIKHLNKPELNTIKDLFDQSGDEMVPKGRVSQDSFDALIGRQSYETYTKKINLESPDGKPKVINDSISETFQSIKKKRKMSKSLQASARAVGEKSLLESLDLFQVKTFEHESPVRTPNIKQTSTPKVRNSAKRLKRNFSGVAETPDDQNLLHNFNESLEVIGHNDKENESFQSQKTTQNVSKSKKAQRKVVRNDEVNSDISSQKILNKQTRSHQKAKEKGKLSGRDEGTFKELPKEFEGNVQIDDEKSLEMNEEDTVKVQGKENTLLLRKRALKVDEKNTNKIEQNQFLTRNTKRQRSGDEEEGHLEEETVETIPHLLTIKGRRAKGDPKSIKAYESQLDDDSNQRNIEKELKEKQTRSKKLKRTQNTVENNPKDLEQNLSTSDRRTRSRRGIKKVENIEEKVEVEPIEKQKVDITISDESLRETSQTRSHHGAKKDKIKVRGDKSKKPVDKQEEVVTNTEMSSHLSPDNTEKELGEFLENLPDSRKAQSHRNPKQLERDKLNESQGSQQEIVRDHKTRTLRVNKKLNYKEVNTDQTHVTREVENAIDVPNLKDLEQNRCEPVVEHKTRSCRGLKNKKSDNAEGHTVHSQSEEQPRQTRSQRSVKNKSKEEKEGEKPEVKSKSTPAKTRARRNIKQENTDTRDGVKISEENIQEGGIEPETHSPEEKHMEEENCILPASQISESSQGKDIEKSENVTKTRLRRNIKQIENAAKRDGAKTSDEKVREGGTEQEIHYSQENHLEELRTLPASQTSKSSQGKDIKKSETVTKTRSHRNAKQVESTTKRDGVKTSKEKVGEGGIEQETRYLQEKHVEEENHTLPASQISESSQGKDVEKSENVTKTRLRRNIKQVKNTAKRKTSEEKVREGGIEQERRYPQEKHIEEENRTLSASQTSESSQERDNEKSENVIRTRSRRNAKQTENIDKKNKVKVKEESLQEAENVEKSENVTKTRLRRNAKQTESTDEKNKVKEESPQDAENVEKSENVTNTRSRRNAKQKQMENTDQKNKVKVEEEKSSENTSTRSHSRRNVKQVENADDRNDVKSAEVVLIKSRPRRNVKQVENIEEKNLKKTEENRQGAEVGQRTRSRRGDKQR